MPARKVRLSVVTKSEQLVEKLNDLVFVNAEIEAKTIKRDELKRSIMASIRRGEKIPPDWLPIVSPLLEPIKPVAQALEARPSFGEMSERGKPA